MTTIQQRTTTVRDLTWLVITHPMCLLFEDCGHRFRVIYPDGIDGCLDGVQCSTQPGKAWALRKILKQMEKDYEKIQS